MPNEPSPPDPRGKPREDSPTVVLYTLARQGDQRAKNLLYERYRQRLLYWAHGRLPRSVRDGASTEDLVQSVLLHALPKLETFEPRWEGAFLDYLREGVRNKIRDYIRRYKRWPKRGELEDDLPDLGPGPAEEVESRRLMDRYEAGLDQLPHKQKAAIIMRVELGYPYQEIAESLDMPSANAARMFVKRALLRLAECIQ